MFCFSYLDERFLEMKNSYNALIQKDFEKSVSTDHKDFEKSVHAGTTFKLKFSHEVGISKRRYQKKIQFSLRNCLRMFTTPILTV